ncbi:DUF6794 domain-containing protein, partial [Methanobrevibacter sp.]|uniref:DUF6794 domain-containing protein n=1 Tax=Methanobrevibacter sp. TaxID=66852 RepID=UPI003868657B
MGLGNIFKRAKGGYFFSNDFYNLANCLDLSDDDIKDLKRKSTDNLDEIVLLIYDKIYQSPSKEFAFYGELLDDFDEYYYYAYIIDEDRWEDINNKITAEIEIGKINSFYYLDKSFFSSFERDKVWIAGAVILMRILNYLINDYNLCDSERKFIFKEMINIHRNNPLQFKAIKDDFKECVEQLSRKPLIQLKDYSGVDQFLSYFIVDTKLFYFVDNMMFNDSPVDDFDFKYLFVSPKRINGENYYIIMNSCFSDGYGDFSLRIRDDFTKYYLIHEDLLDDSFAMRIDYSEEAAEEYNDYRDYTFFELEFDSIRYSSKDHDYFKINTHVVPDDNVEIICLDPLDKRENGCEVEPQCYDSDDLKEVILQKPFSKEYLEILSLLDFKLSYASQIQKLVEKDDTKEDIYFYFNRKIQQIENVTRDILPKDELKSLLFYYEIKTIILHCEGNWDEIKKDFEEKIDSKRILSAYDLSFDYGNQPLVKGGALKRFKANILQAEINSLIEFREVDKECGLKLAYYLRDLDIYSNDLYKYFDRNLNEDYNPMPQSLAEAIDYLVVNTSRGFIDAIYERDKRETGSLHFSLGMWIRNEFGLNG